MITVTIGNDSRSLQDALSGGWVPQQVHRMSASGSSPCVRVQIRKPPEIDITLNTAGCPRGSGGGRPLTGAERRLLELWVQHHLSEPGWSVGDLLGFLHSRLVRLAA